MNVWNLIMLKLRATFEAHKVDVSAHHVKYTDAEVDAIVATHTAINDAHHVKYTDANAVTAIGNETNLSLRKFTSSHQSHSHVSNSTTPAAQSIPSGAWTIINYNDSQYDNDTMVDLVNNKVIVKTAGFYLIVANIQYYVPAAETLMQLSIFINTVQNKNVFCYETHIAGLSIVGFKQMAINDYVQMKTKHNNGANLNIYGGLGSHNLFVVKLY